MHKSDYLSIKGNKKQVPTIPLPGQDPVPGNLNLDAALVTFSPFPGIKSLNLYGTTSSMDKDRNIVEY